MVIVNLVYFIINVWPGHWKSLTKVLIAKKLTLSRVRHGSNSSLLKFPLSCSSSKSYCPCAKTPKTTPTFRPTLSTPGDKKTVRHSTLSFHQSLLYTGTHVPLGITESCWYVLYLPISISRAAICRSVSRARHWIVYVSITFVSSAKALNKILGEVKRKNLHN